MAEPTLALTFIDYQLRVSEWLGNNSSEGVNKDGAAIPPTDAHDLDLVKRLCNDGWRRFVGSNPQWHWMMPTFQIKLDPGGTTDRTVPAENDPDDEIPRAARYFMPDGFYGHMFSKFTYPPAGPRIEVENTTEEHIRALFAGASTTTGDPYLAAVRPLRDKGVPTQFQNRWEVVFFPTPDSSHALTARCRLWPNKLVDDLDRHNAGIQNDEAVIAAMLAEAERQREGGAGPMTQYFADALTRAIAIDQKSTPRRLGYNRDASDIGDRLWPGFPYYTGVDTYNGQTLTF